MNDLITQIAFALHATPGAYALLLGSGVSRAAGIPTGWEVVIDMCARVAAANGFAATEDPVAWYRARYGIEPEYSTVLALVAGTREDRAALLRSYFEPDEEERASGRKLPTAAHRSIARLVGSGHVKVVLTTNFDRLLEVALAEHGIVPTVISTADAARGALPIIHSRCTIIKLHGDYLDTRIKNTAEELETYNAVMRRQLLRVLDEFGLIICGWSGQWDAALRDALQAARTQRFTTYWADPHPLAGVAAELSSFRRATYVSTPGADAFFGELSEAVESLDGVRARPPATKVVAVATLKRYLVSPEHRIRLHDLVLSEATGLVSHLCDVRYAGNSTPAPTEHNSRLKAYTVAVEVLAALLANGAYWGGSAEYPIWCKALTLVANTARNSDRYVHWSRFRKFPALYLSYAHGIASVARGDYDLLLGNLLATVSVDANNPEPLVFAINSGTVCADGAERWFLGAERARTPVSEVLYKSLQPLFEGIFHEDAEYEASFDRFEYFRSLLYADLRAKGEGFAWAPDGRFRWKYQYNENPHETYFLAEAAKYGAAWRPFAMGLFGGSERRLEQIAKEMREAFRQY